MDILVSLYKGYGMGDAVQMSAVLRHLRKLRPDWTLHYQAEEGRHQVGRGIAHYTFAYGQPYPIPEYTGEVQILLYDTFANWPDRPNTRVSSCLHERFDLPWHPECSRYQINISDEAYENALTLVPRNCVAFHYKGDSAKDSKDLTDTQAELVFEDIKSVGHRMLLLDWRKQWPLSRSINPYIYHVHDYPEWGGLPEMNTAVISQCSAFIGIDSGPSKCAAATNTPSLVVWTGHHPAAFYDPAPNVTHLVPHNYQGVYPIVTGPALEFFLKNYSVRYYDKRQGPVGEIRQWLQETLR